MLRSACCAVSQRSLFFLQKHFFKGILLHKTAMLRTSSTPAGTACTFVICRAKPTGKSSSPFHQLWLPIGALGPRGTRALHGERERERRWIFYGSHTSAKPCTPSEPKAEWSRLESRVAHPHLDTQKCHSHLHRHNRNTYTRNTYGGLPQCLIPIVCCFLAGYCLGLAVADFLL